MHYNPNWNKDRVKRKNSLLMLFVSCNVLTNSSQSPHELEVGTTTSVDPLFSRLEIKLWDSNGGGNRERW